MLAYALNASVAQVEERCRHIRNVSPESVHEARRVWERRSLSVWRDEAHGTLRLTVEIPIEEGDLIAKAIDCAVAAGEVSTGIKPDVTSELKGAAWRAQQADALIAIAKAYLDHGGAGGERSSAADHYQVVVHVDDAALREQAGRSDLPLDTVRRLTLQHWADGGDTSLENLTLLRTHHHRLLHEGGFRIEREGDGVLRFLRADGRAIPRGGYRLDDFMDDDNRSPSREGFCTTPVQQPRDEVRERRAAYRVRRIGLPPAR